MHLKQKKMATFGSKIHIEAMQTVHPTKPTDPRKSYTISNIPQQLYSTILQRRFQIILCYNKSSNDDSGWMLAGWTKESLGRALAEQPIFAGRLRRSSELESTGGSRNLHIVTNDCGIRMVEAKVDMKLTDFLDLKSKRDAEVELAFWEDIDIEDNLQFSPLFYVQITNFECGGYSIGISCSILLADPFTMISFLKKWANLHNNIVSNTDLPRLPIFYFPNHKNHSASTTPLPIGSNTLKNAAQTVIFKVNNIPPKILNQLDDINAFKNLATLCIDEAERDAIGAKIDDEFSLFLKNIPFDHGDYFAIKAEVCSRKGSSNKINYNGLSLSRILWDDELGAEEICFNQENKPVYVSCWINSIIDEGSVMIVSSDEHDHKTRGISKIIVTFSTTY